MSASGQAFRSVPSDRRSLRGFRRAASGNVSMMFAAIGIPLCGAIGLAVDMGRIYHVNLATQSALDAAALAAGRVAQVEKKDTITKASQAASAYFDAIKPADVITSSIQFVPNAQQTAFDVTATSWISTPFLSVLNIFNYKGSEDNAPPQCKGNYYACAKMVRSATAQICLNCSDTGVGNSDDGKSLEISMMLDVTGSMKGTALTDMIAAAKDLVDIVVWDDQSKYTSRVALAPFAPAVNVGDAFFTAITGKSDDADPDGDGYNYPSNCYSSKTGKLKSSCEGDSEYKVKRYARCVYERTGTQAATDAVPTELLNMAATVERTDDEVIADLHAEREDRAPDEGSRPSEEDDRRLHGERDDSGAARNGVRVVLAIAQLEHRVAEGKPANCLWHRKGGQDRCADD